MGQAVLVSFCNVSAPHLPLLGLFFPQSQQLTALRLPNPASAFKGVTGIILAGEHLYAVGQFKPREGERATSRSALLVFSTDTLDLLSVYEFRVASDAHSLAWSQGRVYVASSGTDQIVELELKGTEVTSERPYLQAAQGQLADLNHLNGLCDTPDGLVMSAFGLRTDPSWSSATNGFIFSLKRRERIRVGLQHPHTPFWLDGSLAFCESRRTSVETVDGARRQGLPGYSRGICRWGDELLVATSVGRKTSRSTGKVVENPGVAGVVAGGCTISRLRLVDFGLISTFEAPWAVTEIYDLLALEDVDRWPVDPHGLSQGVMTHFAIYPQSSEAPYHLQDPTAGSAVVLLSDEASAKRLASLLAPAEVRRLEGKDAIFEVLEQFTACPSFVAIDVRFDQAAGVFPTRLVPVDEFKRGLGIYR